MREIVFDTETTGTRPDLGHRIVELGAVEIINGKIADSLQLYFNPERKVDAGAYEVHGLSDDFLAKQPKFAEKLPDILEFFADSPLIAHNADFDRMFLNAELKRCDYPAYSGSRFIDTLKISRKLYKSGRHSLDALCQRHNIDISDRTLHGALKDSQLLAKVYLIMTTGLQHSMVLDSNTESAPAVATSAKTREYDADFSSREVAAVSTDPEIVARHEAFVTEYLQDALWLKK